MHDHTQPTTYFKTYQLGNRAVVLRGWMPPLFFKIDSLNRQFARSRPIPELQTQPRPSHYQCHKEGDDVPLAIIGVFSTAAAYKRRNLLRLYEKPKQARIDGHLVEFKFIIGQPKQEKDRKLLHKEMESHDDIVLLDEKENIIQGKTYAFFRWLAQRPGPKPQFAFKVDDDTLLNIPNLVKLLGTLDCNDLYYMGACQDITCGIKRGYPAFFTGLAYGLSSPLYQWLGNANVPKRKQLGPEDVRTAAYLLNLDKTKGENLISLHLHGRMGEWKYWNRDTGRFNTQNVIAIHGLKKDEDLRNARGRMWMR